ncbi:MAG TPA: hypothetical protein VMU54_19015 [Planctomycetota bacterium]|nr:hypothetical protein [Planctomycetota bacterium]
MTIGCGVLALFLLVGAGPERIQGQTPDPRVKPGQTLVIPFPGLPQTLAKKPSELHIYIPRKYDPARQHPLFLWLNGNDGPPGINTGPVGEDNFVVASMPLYKINPAEGLLLKNDDARFIWSCWKPMLAELERLVPNLNPEIRVVGGFSNGANCQAVLLNKVKEFADGFKGFLLWEGGNMLDNFKVLQGHSLFVLYGEKSLGKYGAPIAVSASKAGADAEFFEMKGVGHDAPASFNPKVHDWIERRVLFKDLPDAFRAMTDAVKRSRWAEAVREYHRVSGVLLDDTREEAGPTKEAFRKISLAAEEAAGKLPGAEPTKATVGVWKKFVRDWSPCPAIEKVRAAVDREGEDELKEVLAQAESARPRALHKFMEEWEGFNVREAAVASLEETARRDLEELVLKSKVPALLHLLEKCSKEYEGTPSARKAQEKLQELKEEQASTFLDRIKRLPNAADRKRSLQDLIKAYDGTRAAAEARTLL